MDLNSAFIQAQGVIENSSVMKKYWPDIYNLDVYKAVDCYIAPNDVIEKIIHYLYIQLIMDVLNNRAVNEHIAPVINRLKKFCERFYKVF